MRQKLVFLILTTYVLSVNALWHKAPPPSKSNKGKVENSPTGSGDVIIGIDLGTTYSCVGVYQDGKIKVIENEEGNTITPSIVAFHDEEGILVGDPAKRLVGNTKGIDVIDGVKRIIGRDFSDSEAQHDMKRLLKYKTGNVNGRIGISVTVDGNPKMFSPEQLSAKILTKMKQIAEDYLGHPVKKAVITVPANFNNRQRKATKIAGEIAGLEVVRMINEPTAAAMAYNLHTTVTGSDRADLTVAVFDLGGGTLDVSFLEASQGTMEVITTGGDRRLGGLDYDNAIKLWAMREFKAQEGIAPDTQIKDKASWRKLAKEVERAKIELSTESETQLAIPRFFEGHGMNLKLTCEKFEDLTEALSERVRNVVKKTLQEFQTVKAEMSMESKIDKVMIYSTSQFKHLLRDELTHSQVLLVGGSSRMPKIRQLLKKIFPNVQLVMDLNPDEAVAHGAAVQGAVLSKGDGNVDEILLIDVTPVSLGIETVGGVLTRLIERFSPIPNKRSEMFSTAEDNQPAVTIQVYEGEATSTAKASKLGQFDLNGIPPAPRGTAQILVTFEIDASGVLSVSAEDKKGGEKKAIKITSQTGQLGEDEIRELRQNEAIDAGKDKSRSRGSDLATAFKAYLQSAKASATDPNRAQRLSTDEKQDLVFEADRWLEWIRKHPEADDETIETNWKKGRKEMDPILKRVRKYEL